MDKQILEQTIADQRALTFKKNDLPRLKELPNDREIVIISGVRRCGKSTLLQEIRSKNEEQDYFLNFDDERLISFSVEDFQMLLEIFQEYFGKQSTFYFDEIQNVKGWERFVRRLHDYGNKIYITGSNASMLSRELGTHLTGRYYQYELYPFSFKEYVDFETVTYDKLYLQTTDGKALLKSKFNHYFQTGAFPAFLKNQNAQYMKSLYESVMYRDVMVRNSLTNEKEILQLVHFIASNPSKLSSYSSLAKVIGVKNATTIKNYLNHLEDSYLLFRMSKYSHSLKIQLRNPEKTYMIDLGLLRTVGFQKSEDKGRLLENLVFLELKRSNKEVFYHNEKKECDFVIKENHTITEAIQVCWSVNESETTRQREVSGLLDALTFHNLKSGLILTESEEEHFEVDGFTVSVLPVWKWMLVR